MELKKSVYIESLGCAKNLVDSEVMMGFLVRAGFQFTAAAADAEIIIINTCSFIADAVQEAIETILELVQHKQQGSCRYLIVCGCLPQRYREELVRELPEVDLFLGTGEFQTIVHYIQQLESDSLASRMFVTTPTFLPDDKTPRIISTPGSSAYIKIADGCSHHCTYCTIPGIRGPYIYRPITSIVKEAHHLAENGIVELNLIAQDTTQYPDLAVLLQQLAAVAGIEWIRLLYCHPLNLSRDIIRVMAEEKKICNYIDLPLQHITDSMLKRMGRRMTRKQTEAVLEQLRDALPEIALRTTFMVGFPGETDEDFQQLVDFIRAFGFDHLGVFSYRDEEGTPAAGLGEKVPEPLKKERYDRVMRLQAAIARDKNRRRVGQSLDVLVEDISSEQQYRLQARTVFQAPEVDGVVFLDEDVTIGSFVPVTITGALTYDLVGTLKNHRGSPQ